MVEKECSSQPINFSTSNFMNKIGAYFRDSYKELKDKVSWPTWAQLQQSTMIVLAATIVITFVVLAMDFVIGNGLKFFYSQLFS
jgi:preprotein translocase subunit SecE